MIILRSAKERGHNQINWLNSYHTFSFANYHDDDWMGRGYLRVINEDYIKPSQGFDMHPHRDMEIITYVISGALRHHDSMGNGSVIKPGEIQRMSAGSGVRHSEFNDSDKDELHLLQIWILPQNKGIEPGYEQKTIPSKRNQLILIGSQHPRSQAVKIHQNIELYVGYFDKSTTDSYPLNNCDTWLQLIHGQLRVNEREVNAGDGVWIQQEEDIAVHCLQDCEFLLFKML